MTRPMLDIISQLTSFKSQRASCLRQVKTMKDEKQELLRVIEELRAENGNLQVTADCKFSMTSFPSRCSCYSFPADACVPAQELVGFLTESAEMAEDPDDFQVKASACP